MRTQIGFDTLDVDNSDSYWLDELASMIQDQCDVTAHVDKKASEKGVKDSGLSIGIAIVGLTLAGIQTLVSVLQYWQSRRQEQIRESPDTLNDYSVQMLIGHKTINVSETSVGSIQEQIFEINTQGAMDSVEIISIKISKKY